MPSIKLSDVKKALPLAKKLATAVDVDKNKAVTSEEIKRVRVRDQFASRNLLSLAVRDATYPHDMDARPAMLAAQFEVAYRSLEKADKNQDGVVSTTELSKASQLARALAAFATEHGGGKIADFDIKPYEKPGSKEWNAVAQREYYDVKTEGGQPRFGTALVLKRSELPAPMRKEYDAFRAEHPTGPLEASSYTVNGAAAFYFHVKQPTRVDVLLLDGKGKRLSEGVLTGSATNWTAPWKARWSDA